ncbi:hypothetical protein [Pollutibacter soli]|uniref:hypothetical protein n=1 Tax=Pollutibacter soli TaxID=3034157 RepID=UPI0030132205
MGNTVRRIMAAILVVSVPVLLYGQPANDLRVNTSVLTPGITYTRLTGQTLLAATSTAGLPGNCGNAWFVVTAA